MEKWWIKSKYRGLMGEQKVKWQLRQVCFFKTPNSRWERKRDCLLDSRKVHHLPAPPSPRETSIGLLFDGKEEGVQERLTLNDAIVINSLISEEMA